MISFAALTVKSSLLLGCNPSALQPGEIKSAIRPQADIIASAISPTRSVDFTRRQADLIEKSRLHQQSGFFMVDSKGLEPLTFRTSSGSSTS